MSLRESKLQMSFRRRALPTTQALLLGGALGVGAATAALAQDATPGAGACVPPAATTATGAMASPAAAGDLAATPASDEIAARAAATVDNFVACWNSGDLGATLALVTPNLLQGTFGVADAAAAEAALPELDLGAITLLETGTVNTYDDGRASIDVTYLRGDYQHVDARWYMVEQGGDLLVDQEELLVPRPEGDQAVVGYAIADDGSAPVFDAYTEIPPSPVIVLSGVNNGTEPRVVRLVRLQGNDLAATPVPGEAAVPSVSADIVALGQTVGLVTIEPGAREDLAQVDLPEGVYALDDGSGNDAATLTIAGAPEA